MLATGAATVPKRDNHDTRRWASSNATTGNKRHDSQSKGRRRFAPIVEWLAVFEHIASKCQVAMRQIPGGNGRIGPIATFCAAEKQRASRRLLQAHPVSGRAVFAYPVCPVGDAIGSTNWNRARPR
jgi:hypothetical protein